MDGTIAFSIFALSALASVYSFKLVKRAIGFPWFLNLPGIILLWCACTQFGAWLTKGYYAERATDVVNLNSVEWYYSLELIGFAVLWYLLCMAIAFFVRKLRLFLGAILRNKWLRKNPGS